MHELNSDAPKNWLLRKRADAPHSAGLYWRPRYAGYTSDIAEAGRYTEAEAQALVSETTEMVPDTTEMVAEPEALPLEPEKTTIEAIVEKTLELAYMARTCLKAGAPTLARSYLSEAILAITAVEKQVRDEAFATHDAVLRLADEALAGRVDQ